MCEKKNKSMNGRMEEKFERNCSKLKNRKCKDIFRKRFMRAAGFCSECQTQLKNVLIMSMKFHCIIIKVH